MPEKEFYIDFMIRGRNYTGLVATRNKNEMSSFIVRYAMEPACLVETTLELYPVVGDATEPLEWLEVLNKLEHKPSERLLIKIIGEALEGREI